MIDLFTWNSPDGHSVATMLEAIRLPYRVHPIDMLDRVEQPAAFQAISPNRVPALIDPNGPDGEPISVFGCIPVLIYLADKSRHFQPERSQDYYQCLQWASWQQSDVAPVLSRVHEVLDEGLEQLPVALEHQTRLLWQALANQLSGKRFICGEDLTIADFALYPWVVAIEHPSIEPRALPPLARWLEQLADIEFVQQGRRVP